MSEQTTTLSTRIPAVAWLAPARIDASAGLATRLSTMVGTWIARSSERRALGDLAERNDRHMLEDIGLTREQALGRAAKRFWQT